MPRWTFENKITLGNLIQIGFILAGAFAAYYGITSSLAKAEVDNQAQDRAIAGITERLNSKDVADTALLAAVNSDRVTLAAKLSEMATDIRYLRRERENEKRLEGASE